MHIKKSLWFNGEEIKTFCNFQDIINNTCKVLEGQCQKCPFSFNTTGRQCDSLMDKLDCLITHEEWTL